VVPKVLLTEVLHPDQPLFRVMMVDPGGIHSYTAEKIRNSHKSLILGFIAVVFYQNQRLITVESHPIVPPVGSSLFER
jgi:hypothetical protein